MFGISRDVRLDCEFMVSKEPKELEMGRRGRQDHGDPVNCKQMVQGKEFFIPRLMEKIKVCKVSIIMKSGNWDAVQIR